MVLCEDEMERVGLEWETERNHGIIDLVYDPTNV
jgi:hypothetical protein